MSGEAGAGAAVRAAGVAVFPGFRLLRLGRTSSTQDVVRAAAGRGAAEGYCCVAAEQTAGRGRAGRSWAAPTGTALLVSLLLRRRPAVAAGIPLAAGLAVAGSVEEITSVRCRLKWPNDVLVDGRKLAGVLVEGTSGDATVLGIGVNLAVRSFPAGVEGASLDDLAAEPVSGDVLLALLLRRIGERLRQLEAGGVPALVRAWTERAAGLGKPVRAVIGERTVEGVAAGLDGDGALLLDTQDGRLRLVAGDVHLLP